MKSNPIISVLEKARKSLYRGPIKRIAVSLGLEKSLREGYSQLLSKFTTDQTFTLDIGDEIAKFHVTNGVEVQRFQELMEEESVIESVLTDITPQDVFYDVGANVGLYTCFVGQISNRCVAFEPHPVNCDRLRENIELNNISNVEIRKEALSNTNGTANLAIAGSDAAGEGAHTLSTENETNTITVSTIRGDDLKGIPAPDVMKIDVEGSELSVLRGMNEMLEQCRIIYCETHADKLADRGESHQKVVDQLKEAGFSVDKLNSRGEETFLRATK
ncbi:FkbM family methyltransferase [Halorubrum sp. LN27]|uniref:FkbM family methyltransferase n=1 Tax=Halorubrum sp. LN27 TaxID=2801032 RepID=UPI00190AFC02|nr:FkbM family methyltransferase [Halorubrum sp. LN27]